jgi:hypothetical protein
MTLFWKFQPIKKTDFWLAESNNEIQFQYKLWLDEIFKAKVIDYDLIWLRFHSTLYCRGILKITKFPMNEKVSPKLNEILEYNF